MILTKLINLMGALGAVCLLGGVEVVDPEINIPTVDVELKDPNILYCDNNIRIKNLYRDYALQNQNTMHMDILFNQDLIEERIFLLNKKYPKKNRLTNPNCALDSTKAYEYQSVSIPITTAFGKYTVSNETISVVCGDITLFTFKTKRYFEDYGYIDVTEEEFSNKRIFTRKLCVPMIKNSTIDYPTEVVDLSGVNLGAIKNYYYGRFPIEYVRIKYKNNLYNKFYYGDLTEHSDFGLFIALKSDELFENSQYVTKYADEGKIFYYNNYIYNGEYLVPQCSEGYQYSTFDNGIIERTVNIGSETDWARKPTDDVTYPLFNLDRYYEFAKNMEVVLLINVGYYRYNPIRITFTLDLKKDYFFNHSLNYDVEGSFNNPTLDTEDIYA